MTARRTNVADALGLVAGTVPATPVKYSVSLAPGQYAQLDDVMVTERGLPGRGGIQIAGMVTNVEAVYEGPGSPPTCSSSSRERCRPRCARSPR
jgi:hypothetical protein